MECKSREIYKARTTAGTVKTNQSKIPVGESLDMGTCLVSLWYQEETFVISTVVISFLIYKRKPLDSLSSRVLSTVPLKTSFSKKAKCALTCNLKWEDGHQSKVQLWPRHGPRSILPLGWWVLPAWTSGEGRGQSYTDHVRLPSHRVLTTLWRSHLFPGGIDPFSESPDSPC